METTHTNKKNFGWGYLIVGVIFVVAAVVAFTDPVGNLEAIAFAFAAIAILNGIWNIASPFGGGARILVGILEILLGIFMFANIWLAVAALPYIFAAWFLIDAIFRLAMSGYLKGLGSGPFVFSIVVNILSIIVGLLLLFSPVVAAITLSTLVGLYQLLFGAECIVWAFIRRNLPAEPPVL